MSFNAILRRALRSPDAVTKYTAKVGVGGLRYADRLLGTSARKFRAQHDIISKQVTNPSMAAAAPQLKTLQTTLGNKAHNLTRQSLMTRIKTGVGIGGAGLLYSSAKNQQNSGDAASSGYGYGSNYPTYY